MKPLVRESISTMFKVLAHSSEQIMEIHFTHLFIQWQYYSAKTTLMNVKTSTWRHCITARYCNYVQHHPTCKVCLYIVYQVLKEPPKTDTKDKTTPVQSTSTSQEGKGSLAELFKPKGGEWSCPACAVKNGAAVTNCPCCNTAKPGTEGDKSTQVT